MKTITILLFLCSTTSVFGKDIFYMMRGNLFDRHSPIHKDAELIYENFVKDNFPQAHFRNIHNHKWRSLCDELESFHQKNEIGRIVLLGHSWGAQTSISLAHCMLKKNIPNQIDLYFSFDPVHKPFHKSAVIVPSNIEQAFNWYQRQDFKVKGLSNMRRSDGLKRGISESKLIFENTQWMHDRVMFQMLDEQVIQKIIMKEFK
tara:strand:+ start:107524 stop:108132 length:609 start_codon:yes stop_codon:yes gene_type:complete